MHDWRLSRAAETPGVDSSCLHLPVHLGQQATATEVVPHTDTTALLFRFEIKHRLQPRMQPNAKHDGAEAERHKELADEEQDGKADVSTASAVIGSLPILKAREAMQMCLKAWPPYEGVYRTTDIVTTAEQTRLPSGSRRFHSIALHTALAVGNIARSTKVVLFVLGKVKEAGAT